ncbi:MAG TPA: endonuclease III domain-containing protein [Firmicutes bacterium]|nr:endonuclease III domain-containing protein [Bacillota bacterium]
MNSIPGTRSDDTSPSGGPGGEGHVLAQNRVLMQIYELLLERFGPQHWWPGETPFEVVVGAILTQSAAWRNVERAISNLKAADSLSMEGILSLPVERLSELVRPSGYFNMKARKLKAVCSFLAETCSGDLARMSLRPLDEVRKELLSVYGIGPETADSILLYACNMPTFVVDAYTRRIFGRLGLVDPKEGYEDLRRFFMDRLPKSVPLFNEYHALLVALGKNICLSRKPKCGECPLNGLCARASGRQAMARY